MASQPILLIDQRHFGTDPGITPMLEQQWSVHRLWATSQVWQAINEKIKGLRPSVLCFEFDYPDFVGLSVLRKTKHRFPSIPIIMITEQSSDALAVWALRSRVWDYLSRPFSENELFDSIRELYSIMGQSKRSPARRLLMPPASSAPVEARLWRVSTPRAFRGALLHVEQHLNRKIRQQDLAQAFGMTPSKFSRLFKQMSGMTFREYLTGRRLREACIMLRNPSATVSDVCYVVGFNDVSHFIRSFRRHTGMTPSRYQKDWRETRSQSPSSLEEAS